MAQRGTALAAALVVGIAAPAAAQDEAALKAFFEGKRVVTRIDLPGTEEGVDVRVDSRQAIDGRKYGDRLKTYGTALRAGEPATVTLVKVKKDLIEFQLNGGGYGTFGDDTSTSVYIPYRDKSSREKELDRLVRDESNDRRRHELERELDDLRERRERENRRIEYERERASEVKRMEIADRRLRGGSRFNIRYDDAVPRTVTPDDVMAALTEYVDFSALGWPPPPPPSTPMPTVAMVDPGDGGLHKGMLREDVERRLGPAQQASEHREGSVVVTTLVYLRGDQRISVDFIEGVLVRYAIESK
jgi:hypothetical protein